VTSLKALCFKIAIRDDQFVACRAGRGRDEHIDSCEPVTVTQYFVLEPCGLDYDRLVRIKRLYVEKFLSDCQHVSLAAPESAVDILEGADCRGVS